MSIAQNESDWEVKEETDKGQVPSILSPSNREPVLKVLEQSIDVVP
jgi:hypothetical protein